MPISKLTPDNVKRLTSIRAMLQDDSLQERVERAFKANKGNWGDTMAALEKTKLPAQTLKKVDFVHSLADVSLDNQPLISALSNLNGVTSMRELALNHDKASIAGVIPDEAIQPDMPGKTLSEKKASLAAVVHNKLFAAHTSPVVQQLAENKKLPIADEPVRQGVVTFLSNQPDFNLRTTSLYSALQQDHALNGIDEKHQQAVIGQLKTLQRVQAISPSPESMATLLHAGFSTGTQVADMNASSFMKNYGGLLGSDVANQIIENAANLKIRNETTLRSLSESVKGTGVAMIDGEKTYQDRLGYLNEISTKNNGSLNWENFFGSLDLCDCCDCQSVYSPSSYYVELLQFLRNNDLDKVTLTKAGVVKYPNTGKLGIVGTPVEKLFHRRPDLGCLELTCANTNTILPYLDIVLEVMESFVVHLNQFKVTVTSNVTATTDVIDVWNTEDETSSELLAQPQHTNYDAYKILKQNAIYPFTLPYHQPVDAIRTFLNFLGTSRYELIKRFQLPGLLIYDSDSLTLAPTAAVTAANAAALESLTGVVISRALSAESLSLTEEEYVILTKESFWEKQYFDIAEPAPLSVSGYQNAIGVKNVWEYYGYKGLGAMIAGNQLVKDQFLNRTGILYTDLVNLLKTTFINPNYPDGAALTILDSIMFSYRYLQSLVDKSSHDPKIRFKKLVAFLKTSQPMAMRLEPSLHPDPCHPIKKQPINTSVFEKWVCCYFEKIGKLIVLESGDGPYLPIQGDLWVGNSKKLGTLTPDGKVFDTNGVQVGNVDINGLVNIKGFAGRVLLLKDGPAIIGYIQEQKIYRLNSLNGGSQRDVRQPNITWLPPKDTCDIDKVRLKHLDGTNLDAVEYDRIHRFIRLWRKTGWSIDELDKALIGLGARKKPNPVPSPNPCGCKPSHNDFFNYEIDAELLHQLSFVLKLLPVTGLELSKLLSFWADISTAGTQSLYQRLFLSHSMIGIDPIFKADADGNYLSKSVPEKITDHYSVLMAAFNLKAVDIDSIMAFTALPDKVTLPNISTVYRYSLLMKILGLKSYELASVFNLFGDPFASAEKTEIFFRNWKKMEDAGFNYRQLSYLINNQDDIKKPLTPKTRDILVLVKTLYDGLNKIQTDNLDIPAADIEKADSDLVRSKLSLLYDGATTEQIMNLLEGTTVYSYAVPDKTVTLVTKTSDFTNGLLPTLLSKVKYDFENGGLQVTGILTPVELANLSAKFGMLAWTSAIADLYKKPLYFFNDILSSVLTAPVAPLQAILLQGDVIVPGDPSATANTAWVKRFNFINGFLPYLRTTLEQQVLLNTLSNRIGMSQGITFSLSAGILKTAAGQFILEIFRSIKDQMPSVAPWAGYLVPATEGKYTFVVTTAAAIFPATIKIEGQLINFTQQVDPTTSWLSDPVNLKSGTAYLFEISGLSPALNELQWKTPTTAPVSIPNASLIGNDIIASTLSAFIQLQKASLLVNGFNLSLAEVNYFSQHGPDFGGLDFNVFTLDHWKRLNRYTSLRNSIPVTNTNLIAFFSWIGSGPALPAVITRLSELTLWKVDDLQKLLSPAHFSGSVADFLNEKKLVRIQEALAVAAKINIDINTLFNWGIPSSKFQLCHTIAESIRITTKARYNETDWEQIVKPMNDMLRENQRDALMNYLLVEPDLIKWGVVDADSLFEFFLIDVKMDACMETSRMKQAISSVQLFIQRCFLGLESKYGIANDLLDRGRWEWMQRFQLWVANRKIFLYPENWIEEDRRDDKSSFFTQLQAELLQKDINPQIVQDAIKTYLYKLDEVANVHVVSLHFDKPNKKIHVFARTHNAPYLFYYRYFNTEELTWTSWAKIEVDIPSYDVEDKDPNSQTKGQVIENGCYLTGTVFENRLLVFFPQIVIKNNGNSQISQAKIKDLGDASVTTSQPLEFWEIKLACSEYRNGKWTQKIVSKDAVYYNNKDGSLPPINTFAFVPVNINDQQFFINIYAESFFFNGFQFVGNQIMLGSFGGFPNVTNSDFHYFNSGQEIHSLQATDIGMPYSSGTPYFSLSASRTSVYFNYTGSIKFYDEFVHGLLGKIETDDLTSFFESAPNTPNAAVGTDQFEMFGKFLTTGGASVYNELAMPYSIYNWELFFHTPAILGDSLSKSQQFEEAKKYYDLVFCPTTSGTDANRFWRFWPFRQSNAKNFLENLFNSLQPNTPDLPGGQITAWRNHPFQPHVIARQRPEAYMKWMVMKYLDNLIAWGDYLFIQDTIESLNQATQLYIFASHILGDRPQKIPKRGKVRPESYKSLLNKWDAFGNALVELELIFPFSNQLSIPYEVNAAKKPAAFANIYGFGTSLYFCIPDNPKLLAYWDTIADRLYKIRNCENIKGVFSLPSLWDQAIDPAQLVEAEALGVSISSLLNDLESPLPNYRFNFLIQKSLELCTELKSVGNSLLSAFEKKDAETLANIRARNETNLNKMVLSLRNLQLDEANTALDGLAQNRLAPKYRLEHYLKLIGGDPNSVPGEDTDFNELEDTIETPIEESGLKLIAYEKHEIDSALLATELQSDIGLMETLAGILNIIPNFSTALKPLGVGAGISFGGSNMGAALQAMARYMQINANKLSFQSSNSQRKAGFLRQLQDRVLQANSAGHEIKQIDKQILAQKVRIQIANQEILNQKQQIDNSAEIEDFLQNKYTNEALYDWMTGTIKSLYYQLYTLAFDLAKKAERLYRFERGLTESNFIQFGYWNPGRDGLLSGDQLYTGIKQLETAYFQNLGYDYEPVKTLSLRQIDPIALLSFRETGVCEFNFPELLFDIDFPGHYLRKIKSIAITIPGIVGPYTGINATLRLVENTIRRDSSSTASYPLNTDQDDDRFITFNVPVSAIAVSTGQHDSGGDLNFKVDRYSAFEGAGCISKWRLELPHLFRQFDYQTITDVVIQMNYTSKEGGKTFGKLASGFVQSYFKDTQNISQTEGLFAVFDLRNDFPNEWYQTMKVPTTSDRILPLNNLRDRLPFFTKSWTSANIQAHDIILLSDALLTAPPAIRQGAVDTALIGSPSLSPRLTCYTIQDQVLTLDNWSLKMTDHATTVGEIWMIIRYVLL